MRPGGSLIAGFAVIVATLAYVLICPPVYSGQAQLLQLEAKIRLGNVVGRIDHMAIDLAHQRLFVAELGNGSVSVVDLDTQKVIHRIADFKEPQGLAYVAETDTLYVASAGDGSVRMIRGADFKEEGRIELGDDADNVHVDSSHKTLFVGYGSGSLAVIDVEGQRNADIALAGHPEGFQLEPNGDRIFVNVPEAGSIAVVDRSKASVLAKWSTGRLGENFPMALDEERKEVFSVFRSPPQLAAFSMADGSTVASAVTCTDSDDVFVDAKRRRIYVSCGQGFIDTFSQEPRLERVGRLSTRPGARTSLFVPELDSFFVAVRASLGQPAAIWIYRPVP